MASYDWRLYSNANVCVKEITYSGVLQITIVKSIEILYKEILFCFLLIQFNCINYPRVTFFLCV